MNTRRLLLDFFLRLLFASLTFLGSLVLAALFVGASALLALLVETVSPKGTIPYEIFKWVSSFSLLGVALFITGCGAFVVCTEAFASARDFARSIRRQQGGS